MKYEELKELMDHFAKDEKKTKAIAAELENFTASDSFPLIRVICEYLIAQTLRRGEGDLVNLGRLQGIQSFLDFFDYVPELLKTPPTHPAASQEPQSEEQPKSGGYGLT